MNFHFHDKAIIMGYEGPPIMLKSVASFLVLPLTTANLGQQSIRISPPPSLNGVGVGGLRLAEHRYITPPPLEGGGVGGLWLGG